ncbi:hypothetical protein [Bacillus sp. XF8]|uniref:hypothetical protein n=1 Tax=Bacillus sp. XF8 TaxID=2819289 RepID=UPI001AA05B6A|nr:hypothetical protein [Bacillus sp. XF8]MBO1580129.1 hypothetical protein [Bacillus sp. XF8]
MKKYPVIYMTAIDDSNRNKYISSIKTVIKSPIGEIKNSLPVLKCDYISYLEELEVLYSLGIQFKLLGATLTIFEDGREISLVIVKNQIELHKKIWNK